MSQPAPARAERMVEISGLLKQYGSGTRRVSALRGVELTIQRGERLALLGRSGSGKSTLLNVLGGLDRPTAGRVSVDGIALSEMSQIEMARYRLTTVGMIFQAYNLIGGRTAQENVELPLVLAGWPRADRRAASEAALANVGLGERSRHLPSELSGGERQRVAIARALVHRPALVLADEPTGNLDSATASEVMALLNERVRADSATLVIVTHDEELARRSTDRTVRMTDGRVSL